jgi:hypothetical protein
MGQSEKHYKDVTDVDGTTWIGEEVDHEELIERLDTEYDAWALSASSPSLRYIVPLLPDGVRVMAWVKPFAAFKRNVRVAYTWEPVIVREPSRAAGMVPTRDFVAECITLKKGFTGQKPERFSYWLFNVLGLRPTDEFDDLFPGSGAVTVAWEKWRAEGGPKLKQSIRVTNESLLLNTRNGVSTTA